MDLAHVLIYGRRRRRRRRRLEGSG